jgi:hypothetical protein
VSPQRAIRAAWTWGPFVPHAYVSAVRFVEMIGQNVIFPGESKYLWVVMFQHDQGPRAVALRTVARTALLPVPRSAARHKCWSMP